MKKIGIIGGGGSLGSKISAYFTDLGYQPIICDPKVVDSVSLDELLANCQLLYVSVFPLEHLPPLYEKIAAHPNASQLIIIENSSIKSIIEPSFVKLDDIGASLCATHPLSKADQPWKNQNVILIPYGQHSEAANKLAHALYSFAGMNIHRLRSLKQHDELMCSQQLIPHLVMRLVSMVLSKLDIDLNFMSQIATANFKLFYLSLWRVLVQSSAMSAEIIHRLLDQPCGKEVHQLFTEQLNATASLSLPELITSFNTFYDEKPVSPEYWQLMNQQGIVTLERLVNLEKRSLSIISKHDDVGLLRKILQPFEELNINITAIDSNLTGEYLRFDIGYDTALSSETVNALKVKLGQISVELLMGPA